MRWAVGAAAASAFLAWVSRGAGLLASISGPWSARWSAFAVALPREALSLERWGVLWAAILAVIVFAVIAARRERASEPIELPRLELRALVATLVIAWLVGTVALALAPGDALAQSDRAARQILWGLVPCAALLAGSTLVRAEARA
jgi:hypothetical protein